MRDLILSSQTLRLIRQLSREKEIILTSADRRLATLLAHHGSSPAAFQMPEAKVEARWLDYAVLSGFRWVQIHIDFIDPRVIKECHKRGLNVIACGIEKKVYSRHFTNVVPDAIIVQRTPAWLKKRKL